MKAPGTDYDVVVIGGGAAGLFAAEALVDQGAGTCLMENKKLGGDCTWYGCIPSKALLKAAAIAHRLKHSRDYGIKVVSAEAGFDYTGVLQHVRQIRNRIGAKESPEILRKKGIELKFGSPEFTGPDRVRINDETVRARRIIICTGSRPAVPPIDGLQDIDYLTNETLFELEELPASLLILGGGPVGVELAQAFARLGVKVILVETLERILAVEDEEISELVEAGLRNEGLTILTGSRAVRFEAGGEGVTATLETGPGGQRQVSATKLLLAIGRRPNTDKLSLETGGIACTDKGIRVNAYLQTTNPRVFACGDVVGPYLFTHTAAYQAYICTRNALFRRPAWQKADYDNIAWANFIDPEIAHLGLTEQQAREKHGTVRVYKTSYTEADRAHTDEEKEGLVKVITDKKGYILGAHIFGAQATEIIHPLVLAKSQGIKLAKLAPEMFIYPTLSELVKKTGAKPLAEFLERPPVKFFIRLLRKV